MCAHDADFETMTSAGFVREGGVLRRVLTVRTRCKACKLPFRFLGLSEFGVGGPFAQEGGSTAVLPMVPRDDPR